MSHPPVEEEAMRRTGMNSEGLPSSPLVTRTFTSISSTLSFNNRVAY